MTSMGRAFNHARETMARLDPENGQGTTQPDLETRFSAIAKNGVDAALETMNALPVVSQFSGPASIGLGAGKAIYGAWLTGRGVIGSISGFGGGGGATEGIRLMVSGVKTAGLGAVASVPGVGWIPNAIAAGIDVLDVANLATRPPRL